MTISIEQAKAQLDSLIERSSAGEEVVITRDGRPVARVMPPAHTGPTEQAEATSPLPSQSPRQPGWGKGIITYIAPDFDAPLDDFKEYME